MSDSAGVLKAKLNASPCLPMGFGHQLNWRNQSEIKKLRVQTTIPECAQAQTRNPKQFEIGSNTTQI
tara:strand:- start:308 stop:508 length:201 start_codon:yes stop_codon:yes gene_type:complete